LSPGLTHNLTAPPAHTQPAMKLIMLVLAALASCVTLSHGQCPYMGHPDDEEASKCPFGDLKLPDATDIDEMIGLRVEPDPGQMTEGGCECESSCRPSDEDGFRCDWCWTKGGCGHRGLNGRWGYCHYPANETFEALTFQEKNKYFWSRMIEDKQRSDYVSPATTFIADMQTAFWNLKDEMPAGRKKVIHGVGSVCQFDIDIPSDSPYTGLLSPGQKHGFVRMGGAAKWKKDSHGFPPGVGIKFARSGVKSGNTMFLVSLAAATFDFFHFNLSNHIATREGFGPELLTNKFAQASQCSSMTGLSDFTRYDQDGTKVDGDPKFPFKLFLVPQMHFNDTVHKDIDEVMADLSTIKVGTKIMALYACGKGAGKAEDTPTAGPVEVACGDPFKVGDLVTTTECTTSKYGDESFQFQHQVIEADWQLRPDFLDGTHFDVLKVCGRETMPTATGVPERCTDHTLWDVPFLLKFVLLPIVIIILLVALDCVCIKKICECCEKDKEDKKKE